MTVSDDTLPDRSLLLRTLLPVLSLISADAVACDVTAAYVWGVDAHPRGTRVTRSRLHVAVPKGVTRVSGQAVVPHRELVPAADRDLVEGVRLTSPVRTAADVAARAPSLFAATARLDGFLSRGLVTRQQLVDASHRGRRPPGQLRQLRQALKYTSARSQSPAESWTRVLVEEAHLPPPTPQCGVTTNEGLLHADLGWPEYRVALEYDSLEHHSTRTAQAWDRLRYSAMEARGWRVVAATIHDLQLHPARLLRRILHELTEQGWACSPERMHRVQRAFHHFEKHAPLLF